MEAATSEAHAAQVEDWRRRRYARLRSPIGWLTLAGLHWLQVGENRMGTDADNEIVLPAGPPRAGWLSLRAGRTTAHASPGAALVHERAPADGLVMVADVDAPADAGPTMLELGPLRLCVIRRGDRLALRVWDTEAPARHDFDGIAHFAVDPAWRIDGRFVPADRARTVTVPDVLGSAEELQSPGSVVFRHDGREHRLEALVGGDRGELWLIFGDATNGHETYAGGRYLYTDPPAPDGAVAVDFNRAYNPPCVFGPYATCALPWPANRLPFRVEAGELRLKGH